MKTKDELADEYIAALLDAALNTDSNGYHGDADVSEILRKPVADWPKP